MKSTVKKQVLTYAGKKKNSEITEDDLKKAVMTSRKRK